MDLPLTSAAPSRQNALDAAAAVLLTACVFILLKPYTGIRHDSVLYFGQALLALHPEEFRSDLFFAYGSQAQFTLFPQLLALLMRHASPEVVSISLVVLALCAFVGTTWYLLRQMVPADYRFWALLAVLSMPPSYGALGVFAYGEPFVTGRSFAEPMLLAGLALLLRDRWIPAAFLFALAATTHPLQAAPAFVLAWVLVCQKERRFIHLAWLLVPVAVLGFLGVGPFARLQEVHDPEWLAWIEEPNQHVFMALWPVEAWVALATDLLLLGLARQKAQGVLRRWIDAVLIAGALCFAAAGIFGDGLHLVIPTGLQLWRVHWLMKWTAMACIPFIVFQMWRDPSEDRLRVAMLLATVMLGAPIGRYAAPYALAIIVPMFLAWPRLRPQVTPRFRQLLYAALAGGVLIAYGKFVYFILSRHFGNTDPSPYGLVVILLHPLPMWAFLVWAVRSWPDRTLRWRQSAIAVLVLAIGFAVSTWDRRSNWNRYVEHANYSRSPFGVELKPGAQVYWSQELLTPWLVLRRASYFNGHQESGLLFNRGTAEEAVRREKIFGVLEFQGSVCALLNAFEKDQEKCAPTEESIQEVCADAMGELDYVVLPQKLKYGILGTWHIPKLDSLDRPVTYYLYQCADFAKAGAGAKPSEGK